jgi:hypothetical protein
VYRQDQQLLTKIHSVPNRSTLDDQPSETYQFAKLEEDIIKYICEKIVAMREQPFIDAVDNLKKAQEINNLQMILEMQRNKAKWNTTLNKLNGNTQFYKTHQTRAPTHPISQYEIGAHDETRTQTHGRAMFAQKDRKTRRGYEEGLEEGDEGAGGNSIVRMLKAEEIKEICEKHHLKRMEVYEIRSQYVGLCMMSKEDEMQEAKAQANLKDDPEAERENMEMLNEKMGGKQSDGISLKFFKKNCKFLAGCSPRIIERILVAHGLDIDSSNAVINWHTYLELYCIFEAGKMEKQALIRFWIKFFDIKLRGSVPCAEYIPLLEELVRGTTLSKESETTLLFAKMF